MQDNQQLPLEPAKLGQALKRGVGDIYDRLGLVIFAGFLWFVAVLVPISIGAELSRHASHVFLFVGVLAAFLLSVPLMAGVFEMARRVVMREEPSIADLKAGFTQFLGPAMKLALTDLVVTVVILVDVAFFFGRMGPKGGLHSPLLVVIGVFLVYILLAWLTMMLYHFPILIWQKSSTTAVLKRGFLLTVDNPTFTIGLLFAIILLTILCVVTVIGMAVLFMGAAAILTTNALRELFIKYKMIEEPPEGGSSGWPQRQGTSNDG